jgi:hypothetical protein
MYRKMRILNMKRTAGLSFLPRVAAPLIVIAVVIAGAWSQTGTAAADPGDGTAENNLHVIQKNIQVVAGNQATEDGSSQTASNTLAASQDSAASGGGTARNHGVVVQLNIQVIAGRNCSVDQSAANVASLDQSATATGGRAVNVAVIHQANKQIYVCTGNGGGGGQQTAANVAGVSQNAAANSGTAVNRAIVNQRNRQVTVD